MTTGFITQTAGFIVRWILSEHVPLSNMYEYMGIMSWMTTLSLFIILSKYRRPEFGAYISPIVFMLMVTASLLPKDISQALVPALQSYWITIHVTLAALGSGAFTVACAVSLVYLLKSASERRCSVLSAQGSLQNAIISYFIFPAVFTIIMKALGVLPQNSQFLLHIGGSSVSGMGWFLSGIGLALPFAGLLWSYLYRRKADNGERVSDGAGVFTLVIITLLISALIAGLLIKWGYLEFSPQSSWKVFEFFGVMWFLAVPLAIPIYWILIIKGFPYLHKVNINTDLLDEINYKTISLGYPLYTVGALFAGAIWAEQAWGTFWGWDPKEVGALIIWLFYSGFLHARRQKSWRGERAAALAILGFLMILLSFFGNYFFGGQHAYT